VHASASSFEEINLILHSDKVEVQSHANAYSVKRSNIVIWPHLVLLGVVEEGRLANSRLQKVERLLTNEQAKKRRDCGVQRDDKPLVRG